MFYNPPDPQKWRRFVESLLATVEAEGETQVSRNAVADVLLVSDDANIDEVVNDAMNEVCEGSGLECEYKKRERFYLLSKLR